MKITIPSTSYLEVYQKAPLRWALCYFDGTDYVGQHGWWKCKDFLNDLVIYLHRGKQFDMYGFNNKAKINEEGGYFALKNVPSFFENNLALLNEHLINKGFDPIELHPHKDGPTECVILIPSMYFGNTFLISVITSYIRACVYEACNTFEECVKNEPTLMGYFDKVEEVLTLENIPMMNEVLFLNYQHNGTKPINDTYAVHNAGLQSWLNSWAMMPKGVAV